MWSHLKGAFDGARNLVYYISMGNSWRERLHNTLIMEFLLFFIMQKRNRWRPGTLGVQRELLERTRITLPWDPEAAAVVT